MRLNQVQSVLLETLNSPEEAIRFFLKKLIDGAADLSDHYPRHVDSKVLPVKERTIESRLNEANLLIEKYNSYILNMTVLWTKITKKWYSLKTKDIEKKVTIEISEFENELTNSFRGMNNAAILQSKNISFILENYIDLSKEEISNLNKVKKSLSTISKMTYPTFIKEILEKGEVEEA